MLQRVSSWILTFHQPHKVTREEPQTDWDGERDSRSALWLMYAVSPRKNRWQSEWGEKESVTFVIDVCNVTQEEPQTDWAGERETQSALWLMSAVALTVSDKSCRCRPVSFSLDAISVIRMAFISLWFGEWHVPVPQSPLAFKPLPSLVYCFWHTSYYVWIGSWENGVEWTQKIDTRKAVFLAVGEFRMQSYMFWPSPC